MKTATQGEAAGSDGNKHVKGRKRPIVIDTRELMVVVVAVTAATSADRQGLAALLTADFASG